MLFNPGYGAVGLVVLPFYLIFELVSAVVEVLAMAAFAVGLLAGIISPPLVLLFAAAGLGYGAFLTVISVTVEELTYHRYESWRDFALLVYAAIAENAGYRQLYAWWRMRGVIDAVLRRKADWLEEPGERDSHRTSAGVPAGGHRVRVP
jgi:hypothetical protein